MKYPTYNLEKKLGKQGYQNIVGIDEVGRGALAGPIVAVAAEILKFETGPACDSTERSAEGSRRGLAEVRTGRNWKLGIRDSKLLSESKREKIFEELSQKVEWSIGLVSHTEIDKIGITQANVLVIKRAIENLKIKPDYLLIDQVYGFSHHLPFELIIKGDAKVLSISIASILAKVTRDRMMREFHRQYPDYHFDRHKGYGTALHQKCLKQYGCCKIHRLSYAPFKIDKG